MSIKSKKAEEKLSEFTRYISIDWRPTFESAVELAESDARERAVRAFCDTSNQKGSARCIVWAKTDRSCRNHCEIFNQFLKHYDNDR